MENLLVIVCRSVPLNAIQDRSNDINSPVFSGCPECESPATTIFVPHRGGVAHAAQRLQLVTCMAVLAPWQ
jgi:hypothetical protein